MSSPVLSQRLTQELNQDWRFTLSDDSSMIAASSHESWKTVSIPHDWAFEQGLSRSGAQEDKGGYFGGGIAWYQKAFSLDDTWAKKRILLEFDGVYMNSEVWINGQYLGKRPYGYISFRYNITPFIKPGDNIISVRVDNSFEPSARWYHPCGIYAPVRLLATGSHFIQPNGVFVTTPGITTEEATINIEAALGSVRPKKGTICSFSLLDETGTVLKKVERPVAWNGNKALITASLFFSNPTLWDTDSPYLYQVRTQIKRRNKLLDESTVSVGIREIEWRTDSGFFLNGAQTKLLGVCEHYEGGPVGGAWTRPLLRWKLSLLKEMGVNALRTAHNPAPPMLYDICDELGILVMDEIFDGWLKKAPHDYGSQAFDEWWEHDMTEWITRNRNHPSIIIYSLGNETRGEVAAQLVAKSHELDDTRLVTSGHSGSEWMDVFGVNGGSEKMDFFKKTRPDKPFISTEAPHTWQTRGYYRTKTWFRDGYPNDRQQPFPLPDLTEEEVFHYEWASPDQISNRKQHFNSSYDNAMVRISARKNWELMRDLPWYSGHFRWTGFDYYGEAGYVHGGWPFRLFMSGAIDVAGFKKDLFYFYQSQWTTRPMVHILPHWTHPTLEAGTEIPVWVYSNCEEVELFLNGKSLGKDRPGQQWDDMQCEWMVPYEPGSLLAKGYINGKLVTESRQQTAGSPASIDLRLDEHISPSDDQYAIVTITIQDKNSLRYQYGENQLFYHLSGPASIQSLENGAPTDTTHNAGVWQKRAFMGSSNAFIRISDTNEPVVVSVGAILGERQLIGSASVAIDVKQMALLGESPDLPMSIFYTIDGTEPGLSSRRYQEPFSIELGTVVKAIVFQEGAEILRLEESFDQNLGIYWGKPEDASAGISEGMAAVDARYEGAEVAQAGEIQHLDFKGDEGKISWYQENDGVEGEFILRFLYSSHDPKSARPMALYINGEQIGLLQFPSTGSWAGPWQVLNFTCVLGAGANEIELRTTGKSGPNILSLQVN